MSQVRVAPFRLLSPKSMRIVFHIIDKGNKPLCGSDHEPARRRINFGHLMCGDCGRKAILIHMTHKVEAMDDALTAWNERTRMRGPNKINDDLWHAARKAYDGHDLFQSR